MGNEWKSLFIYRSIYLFVYLFIIDIYAGRSNLAYEWRSIMCLPPSPRFDPRSLDVFPENPSKVVEVKLKGKCHDVFW